MNRSLQRVRTHVDQLGNKSRRAAHDAGQIGLLIVETRVLVLRMTIDAFAKAAGMHKHAVRNAETPGTHPQHESMSRIYRAWRELKVNERTCQRLLDLLITEHDEQGRPWRNTVEGLYRKWMYQAGQKSFRAASKKAKNNRPLTYGTLWQRHVAGVIPDFEELRIIAHQLRTDLKEAERIWSQQKTTQLIRRGVPELLARFIVILQLKHDGLWMHELSLVRKLRMKHSTAEALANCRMPPWDEVKTFVRSVMSRAQQRQFMSQWERVKEKTQRKESFAAALERIRDANGWNNQLISSLLQIKPPEERFSGNKRSANKQKTRREPYRPSAELRRMYQENVFCSQAPAKAVIELIASDTVREGPRNETQVEYLTSLFLEGVDERLRLQGSALEHSDLRKHRVLCGTSADQLASITQYSRDEILLIEQGRIKITRKVQQRLIAAAAEFPRQKVEHARRELQRLNTSPQTVSETVTLLARRLGGYVPLARMLSDDQYPTLRFSCATLKQIEAGSKVPSLPQLKRMITLSRLSVSEAVVRDWYQRMPEYLASHSQLQWKHPLVRGVGLVVFEQACNLRDFWEQFCREDFTYSVVTRNFKQMNGHGNFGWPTISRYLNYAGLTLEDPRRLYLQRLFEHKDDITLALKRKRKRETLTSLASVMRQWKREMRRARQPVASFVHKLGLTADELENIEALK